MRTRAWWIGGGLLAVVLGIKGAKMIALSQDGKKNEKIYAPVIAAAERTHGIPAGMLHRLIATESRFRSDIIAGTTRSRVGAVGIAQFMPATAADEGVDPLNPVASINAAGKYLKKLAVAFNGDWSKAVAAYNYGIGNVRKKVKAYGPNWAANLPAETKQYVKGIVA